MDAFSEAITHFSEGFLQGGVVAEGFSLRPSARTAGGLVSGGAAVGPASRVISAAEIGKLGAKEGTVVLGHYTRPVQGGIQETLPILEAAARQLGGRTLTSLPPDMAAIAPALHAASRIVFFTSPAMQGLTAAEMALIQADAALLAKTVFVYGGF